ncbi:hypothetical protein SDC9_82939 [bioreactor metagenome]|uniref:Uncharacterized protein n=1 Tax=bioreactor metagenome TaxID=1076179 RepID=A0A644ZEP1_9ZZZZ
MAILGDDLLVSFDDFTIGGGIGLIGCFYFFANKLRIKVSDGQRGDGYQCTKAHHQQQIVADAQRICRGNGARCGRDKDMGSIQAGRKANRHCHTAFLGAAHQRFANGV